MERNKKRYSISDIAEITGLSISTLRYYDEKAILIPFFRNPQTGYRYYSEEQVMQALSIRELRQKDFSLNEMRELLKKSDLTKFDAVLEHKKEKINKEIAELLQTKERIEKSQAILQYSLLSQKDKNDEQIEVTTFPEYTGLYLKETSRINVNEIFWDRFSKLYKLQDEYNLIAAGPVIATFHEHYTHQFFFDEGEIEVVLPIVPEKYQQANKDGYIKTFGGFQTAKIFAFGHYKNMLQQYLKLVEWIRTNNYEIIGNPIEVYDIEFTHTINSEDYITEIHFPIKEKV